MSKHFSVHLIDFCLSLLKLKCRYAFPWNVIVWHIFVFLMTQLNFLYIVVLLHFICFVFFTFMSTAQTFDHNGMSTFISCHGLWGSEYIQHTTDSAQAAMFTSSPNDADRSQVHACLRPTTLSPDACQETYTLF